MVVPLRRAGARRTWVEKAEGNAEAGALGVPLRESTFASYSAQPTAWVRSRIESPYLSYGKTMKRSILLLILAAIITIRSAGETMIVSDGATNSIVVATNEVIVVDFIDTNSPYPLHRSSGGAYLVRVHQGHAFAGPFELVFFNDSAIVTFHRLQTTAVTTLILGASHTNLINVPTNKALRIFPNGGSGRAIVTRGTHSRIIDDEDLEGGCELTGPLTVSLTGYSENFLGHEYRQALSYYITDDVLQVTANGYLKTPPGTYSVLVEKSTDLARWFPVTVQSTATSDTSAFYRIRIYK